MPSASNFMRFSMSWLLIVCLFSSLRGDEKTAEQETADVLVFAPHPDDEVLGCAGVMMQRLAEKKRVKVVVLTNGDGFPKAAALFAKKTQEQLTETDFLNMAAIRQRQSLTGGEKIGLTKTDFTFLAYPDSKLKSMYETAGSEPLQQPFTKKSETYTSAVHDYHSHTHQRPAAYIKSSLLGDLTEIIKRCQPREIFVTHDADTHADHQATFWFVRDAAQAADFQGKIYTYINHGRTQPNLPAYRIQLSPEQIKQKKAAIEAHQIPTVHDDLPAYAKEEEIFWLYSLKPRSH